MMLALSDEYVEAQRSQVTSLRSQSLQGGGALEVRWAA